MTGFGKTAKHLVCLVLMLACVISLGLPVFALEDDRVYTYTTAVHNGSSFSARVIGRMEDGTQISVVGQTEKFYKIDCGSFYGYVAKYQVVQEAQGRFVIACDIQAADTQILYHETMTDAITLRHSIMALGSSYRGVPYSYGGMSPRGFDCSGFVKYIYARHGIDLTRTASSQLGDGIIVSKDALQVGDLIFLRYAGEWAPASHVGIYAGNNKILHASSSRGVVLEDMDSSFISANYYCARRVINTAAAQIEAVPTVSALRTTRSAAMRVAP